MKLLDRLLAFLNLRRITRTDRAPKRICLLCARPIKRSGEPWVHVRDSDEFGLSTGYMHRQCPSLPTLPFTPAE